MKRVLIIDDDRATSAGMADVVEEWGYEPEVAGTVKAAMCALLDVPQMGRILQSHDRKRAGTIGR